jgi:autotransporter-associated beta strand protein
MTGSTTTFSAGAGKTLTLNGTIADDSASSLPSGNGYTPGTAAGAAIVVTSGKVVLTNAGNTYAGGTTVSGGGFVNFNSAGNFGSAAITLNGGGLQWASGTLTDISSRLNAIGARAERALILTATL